MECENYVASKLVELGYPVINRNLSIFYNRHQLTEFDIISANFIVEVKSTKFSNCVGSGFNFVHSYDLLPEGFLYFIYSKLSTDDEIKTLNESYTNPSYIFINNIEEIKKYIKPNSKNIECNTPKSLSHIITITDHELNKIDKIYVPKDIYDHVYSTIVTANDLPYSDHNNLNLKIKRIDELVKTEKIVFDNIGLKYLYPLLKKNSKRKKIVLPKIEKLKFNLFYNISDFERDPKYCILKTVK